MAVSEQVIEVPSPLGVRVQPEREVVYVQPVGELDLATAPQLRDQVQELVAVGFRQLVIDLRELSFIDVAGLRTLLSLGNQAHDEGWRLSLTQGRRQVRRLCALAAPIGRLPCHPAPGLARDARVSG